MIPNARTTDPETSHAAGAAALNTSARQKQLILDVLREHGPLSKRGIARHLLDDGIDHIAVARRLPELQRDMAAEPTGDVVKYGGGTGERVWRAVLDTVSHPTQNN